MLVSWGVLIRSVEGGDRYCLRYSTAMWDALRDFSVLQAAGAFRALRANEVWSIVHELISKHIMETCVLIPFAGPPGGSVPTIFQIVTMKTKKPPGCPVAFLIEV